ncbi:hypothetical protein [Nitratiruptor sp. SB155-2]|uniref:hypothetical protein n=1 Tax=Nitratiruptor sp. (strain SB155-2) TaxID=387092 RepID=UPI000317EF60|nr:hypothetical protein [Nitratiruptor sp. SB155-2]
MNLVGFLSMLILIISIITISFGIIAYFLYKAREKKRNLAQKRLTYDEVLNNEQSTYIFFE